MHGSRFVGDPESQTQPASSGITCAKACTCLHPVPGYQLLAPIRDTVISKTKVRLAEGKVCPDGDASLSSPETLSISEYLKFQRCRRRDIQEAPN